MERKYQLKKLAECPPFGGCPAIYEITPKQEKCQLLACPGVYEGIEDEYLIIGKKRNPKDFGLEKKIGKDEVLISVPKKIIDGMKK